jgi:hypothetical protein
VRPQCVTIYHVKILFRSGVLLALALILAGCSSSSGGKSGQPSSPRASSSAPATFDLAATLTIKGPYSTGVDAMTAGAPCIGINNQGTDYEDIAAGSPVAVTDGAGATVGVGTLPAGKMTVVDLATRECVFDVRVAGIPAGRGIYGLTIGNHSTRQMKEADFRAGAAFTLSGS